MYIGPAPDNNGILFSFSSYVLAEKAGIPTNLRLFVHIRKTPVAHEFNISSLDDTGDAMSDDAPPALDMANFMRDFDAQAALVDCVKMETAYAFMMHLNEATLAEREPPIVICPKLTAYAWQQKNGLTQYRKLALVPSNG